jgi:Sec-independent protein secretion pathway component TatC
MPLSIGLMVAGVALVYFAVLPWTCSFFFGFTSSVQTPDAKVVTIEPYAPAIMPHLKGSPPHPKDGEMWIDDSQGKIKIFFDGETRSMMFNTDTLLASHITLSDYIDMVVGLVITFAIAFQMPLVVLALARIGIVEIKTLKGMRRYVYFSMSILAALLAPHDVVTAQLALMVPLILLFELGVFLATRAERRDQLES